MSTFEGGGIGGSGGEVVILARLAGTREFVANATTMGASVERLGAETELTGLAMGRTARRGFLMNQMMFTARRLVYGVSLALIGGAVAAAKWGWDFNNAMQQARVALQPVGRDIGGVENRLHSLYNFTKYTPFQFKDVTIAFRQMYFGMRTLGIGADTVQTTLKSIVDSLSATGRTSPGALNRVAVALQHMAYQGVLTGQAVNQLNRDGIPATAILAKMFHLTGEEIHNVRQQNIPTLLFLQAMNRYIATTPGLANAAYRQATGSLHGLFTTFRDNLAQLMGSIEKGFFARVQNRLVAMNAWFDRFSETVRHGNIRDVIRDIAGGGGVMIWNQLAADLTLFFHILGQVIRQLVQSRPIWGSIFTALALIHGILFLISPLFGGLSTALYIIIPLWTAYRIQLILSNAALRGTAFWTAVNTKATKELTFAQYVARAALKGLVYGYVLLKLAEERVVMWQIALTTWSWRVTAATIASAAAIKFRTMWDWLYVAGTWAATIATGGLTAAVDLLTVAFLANPIGLIIEGVILLITGLVLLYMRWSWFHNLVNSTFEWIVTHWKLLAVILLGPFGIAIVGIVEHFKEVKRVIAGTIGWIWDKMKWLESGMTRLWKHIPGHGLLGSVLGHIPGLAMGGHVVNPGLAMVGEHGRELLALPTGATVIPLNTPQPIAETVGPREERQPLIIQLLLDRRVLAEAYAEVSASKAARA